MNRWQKLAAFATVCTLSVSLAACGNGNDSSNNAGTDSNTGAVNEPAANAAANTGADAADAPAIQPEEGASLLVWESKEERPFTDEIAKEFTAKYNIPVKIDEVASTDQVTRLQTDGPTGVGADVIVFPHDHLGRAVTGQMILPNEEFGAETTANNTENSIQGVSYDGVLYGYPRAAETYALYYNKSLVPDAPKSFDDVIALASKLNDPAKNKYALMWEAGNTYFNYPFIASTGGYLFGNNGTDKADLGMNNEGALEGMKVYQSLKAILPIKTGDVNPDIKRGLFTGGDVAMDINGPWELSTYKEALGDKLGVAPIPMVAGKPAVSFSGIKAWYVSSYSQYPNAAKLFAEFASDKKAQLLLNSKVGSIPTNKEAQADPQITGDEYVSGFMEQFKNSQPMPNIPEMNNVWSPMEAAFTTVWNDNKDPKAALDNAKKQIEELIASNG
ncbi:MULTISPECIES: maltose ABC transporter substrate-binding protein [unclassified Paenibacillus]|uniref:sugar ABC transporter substrate-binding protein n=1 Tax=unclassified Paenibacillus TaxID=185978 RepID=UPI000953F77E|nr:MULTISPECIES: maltose ABC transporter substrate-binding protein [unclassified Paenibacillus]ASS68662.1 maltose ABC transporter substrate-binding protein [Paenibacillus sp. RUD330]SIR55232.1 arabinogalactan oligomer / maltooligosaccharide transport system substrate-binding protein [Paenibacillus sp. RU4X]SIR63738.1 arabinogalactan oligomer / maltooligosaccharide transport system substrate-binding protein [Paenibacillus sp. RU4T]